MKMLATLKVMSMPMVAQIMDGKMYAQYIAPSGAIAKRSGAMIQAIPEMIMRSVPGRRCSTKPPNVEMMQPPSAIGTYHATTCRGVAPIILSM